MTAPKSKAWFGDAIGGKDEVDDVDFERTWIIDSFAREARTFPHWKVVETGTEVELTVIEAVPGRSVIGWRAGNVEGTVTFTPDPSGWILAVAALDGREVGRGYLDHVYEMYDVWPPGATPAKNEESPGHFGKKMSWVGLSTAAWPLLARLTDEGALTVAIDDDRVRSS